MRFLTSPIYRGGFNQSINPNVGLEYWVGRRNGRNPQLAIDGQVYPPNFL
jgi:hypothetical protein